MGDSKSTPVLMLLIAALLGYVGYTGDGINLLGIDGMKTRQAKVTAVSDTIALLQAQIDSAKADLAKESVEDLRKRIEAYRASLGVLRTLVPDETEVANLLDDISIRAKVRGVDVAAFTPLARQDGPAPFNTDEYQFSVVGRFNQVGAFLTDIASLRRIIVPTNLSIAGASLNQAVALGDTTAMLEARFSVRTYVKATAGEEGEEGSDDS